LNQDALSQSQSNIVSQEFDQAEFLRLKNIVVKKFTEENWLELGLKTHTIDLIQGHDRLLRGLKWEDSDYPGNTLDVLLRIVRHSYANFALLKDYVDSTFSDGQVFISSIENVKRITFSPNVFEIPEVPIDRTLVAVMMPFSTEFLPVYESIKLACNNGGLTCKRADDIWEHSILIQDIFRLIFTARVVISDFSRRNPNVMYETGKAHTLGKTVVPITQDPRDVPFDIAHHRVLSYFPNSEGLSKLTIELGKRMSSLP
jgi:hypothetical protein